MHGVVTDPKHVTEDTTPSRKLRPVGSEDRPIRCCADGKVRARASKLECVHDKYMRRVIAIVAVDSANYDIDERQTNVAVCGGAPAEIKTRTRIRSVRCWTLPRKRLGKVSIANWHARTATSAASDSNDSTRVFPGGLVEKCAMVVALTLLP